MAEKDKKLDKHCCEGHPPVLLGFKFGFGFFAAWLLGVLIIIAVASLVYYLF
jgi:hypothetical protein